jgi:hypothetical protein
LIHCSTLIFLKYFVDKEIQICIYHYFLLAYIHCDHYVIVCIINFTHYWLSLWIY